MKPQQSGSYLTDMTTYPGRSRMCVWSGWPNSTSGVLFCRFIPTSISTGAMAARPFHCLAQNRLNVKRQFYMLRSLRLA